jgi:MFS family permease
MKRSPLIIIFITLFIDLLGFGLVLPLIPVYITHYGGTSAVGGWLMASFSVMQFVFAPIWGRASDLYGRRPLILLSLLGSAASFLAFGLAHTLVVLFFARIAAGILTAASLPTTQAYIADVTPPEKRAGGMAMLGAAFGLGFAFGPWLGGLLSKFSVFGQPALATPAFFAAALALVNFMLAFFLLPESLPPDARHSAYSSSEKGILDVFPTIVKAMQHPSVRKPILVFTFATFAFTAVEASFSWLVLLRFEDVLMQTAQNIWQSYQPLALPRLPAEVRRLLPAGTDWSAFSQQPFSSLPPLLRRELIEKASTAVTSVLFGIVGITILIVQGSVMAGLARRFGEVRLVWIGAWILFFVLLGLAFAPNLSLIYVLSALIAVGNGIMAPSLSALITRAAGPQDRGVISGAQQGLGSLARIIAPPINNTMVGWHTPAPFLQGCLPFLLSSLLMAISSVLALQLRRSIMPMQSEEPALKEAGHG